MYRSFSFHDTYAFSFSAVLEYALAMKPPSVFLSGRRSIMIGFGSSPFFGGAYSSVRITLLPFPSMSTNTAAGFSPNSSSDAICSCVRKCFDFIFRTLSAVVMIPFIFTPTKSMIGILSAKCITLLPDFAYRPSAFRFSESSTSFFTSFREYRIWPSVHLWSTRMCSSLNAT